MAGVRPRKSTRFESKGKEDAKDARLRYRAEELRTQLASASRKRVRDVSSVICSRAFARRV